MQVRTRLNRREFLAAMGFTAAAVSIPGCSARSGKRPNVVVIYTDDQEFNQLGCYGGKVLTPHMDGLARDGIKFHRYYASSPVCSPSRYNVLTGRYAGHCRNLQKLYPAGEPAFIRWNTDLLPGEQTIAHTMKRNGYVTGMAGKFHLFDNEAVQQDNPPDADPNDREVKARIKANYEMFQAYVRDVAGFDYAESIYANNLHALALPKVLQEHNQEWITKGALDFIERYRDKPFFFYMATTIPHGPVPLESMKADERITPAGYLDEAPNVQPSRGSVLERTRKAGVYDTMAPLTWLDDGVGAVLQKLDDCGLAENTLVILASDHGSARGKMTCYESGAKAPCIIRWPGKIGEGQDNSDLVSNIDIAPTILDACGIEHPRNVHIDGMSLMPVIRGGKIKWRDSLYLEVVYSRGVVTKDWKYIAVRFPKDVQAQITAANRKEFNQEGARFSSKSITGPLAVRYNADKDFPGYFDDDQLYNIADDPAEQVNLAGDPKYAGKLEEMKQKLKKYSKNLPHAFGEFKEEGQDGPHSFT